MRCSFGVEGRDRIEERPELGPVGLGLGRQVDGEPTSYPTHRDGGRLRLPRIGSAEEGAGRDGASKVDVRVVFPREPDSAEHLDAVLGGLEERLDCERGRGGRGEWTGIVVADGTRRVPHRGPRELGARQHVGATVLGALELSDRTTELPTICRVLGRGVDAPLGRADRVGCEQHGREVTDLGSGDVGQATRGRDRRAVDGDLGDPAREIDALQLGRGEVLRLEHDPGSAGGGDDQIGEVARQHGTQRARDAE